MSTTLSMRLPDTLASKLEQLATAMGRSKSFLATEALERYLTEQAWQLAEVQDAIAEADRGEFAMPSDVSSVFAKWDISPDD